MRRLLFLFAVLITLLALLLASSVSAQATTTPSPTAVGNYVTARDIYVRGGPGEFYLPVGRLVEGDEVRPFNISADGRWVLIRYSRGFGWIRRDLAVWADDIDELPQLDESNLTPTSLATDTPTPLPTGVQIAAGEAGAYVRFGPGVNYPYMGAVVSGEFVDPVGRNLDGDWILIRFRDGFGWVSRALLARNVLLDDLPVLLLDALTPSATSLASLTPTASNTPTFTQTPSQTPTATLIPTNTPVGSETSPATETPTELPTTLVLPTLAPTETLTPSDTPTPIPTNTPTATLTFTLTATPLPSETPTATDTSTSTATATVELTAMPTQTATSTATNTFTSVPTRTLTDTPSPVPSKTATEEATSVVSVLQAPTQQPSATLTRTTPPTSTQTPTSTVTSTATNTPTDTATPAPTNTPTEATTETRTPRPTIVAMLTTEATRETATSITSAETTESVVLPAETETIIPSVTLPARATETAEVTPEVSETATSTATRTPAVAIILPTPVSSLPETTPSTPTISPEALVGGLLLLALMVYVGLYWRGLSMADRYADGFVIQRCPVCQQGRLSIETRMNRVLGIPRPRSIVRCDTCRSVLREAGRHRWRYAVDPLENPAFYKRFNGKIVYEATLTALEGNMPSTSSPSIHPPTKPPVFLDDEE